MSSTKCNYEIYDKNFLIIIKIFEKWKSKCVDTSIENSIQIFIDHKNLKHFMTSKQLNRRQIRWIEFLSKFNFQIIYRSKIQNIKSNNLTRRSKSFSKNATNERTKWNCQILLKNKNLNQNVKNVINLIFDLMNERQMNVAKLISMMYDLIEKNVFDVEKSIKKINIEYFWNWFNKKKSIKKFDIEQFINLIIIMKRIKTTYFENDILQKFMNVKRTKKNIISIVQKKYQIEIKKLQNTKWFILNQKSNICFDERKFVFEYYQNYSWIKINKSCRTINNIRQNKSSLLLIQNVRNDFTIHQNMLCLQKN